MKHSNGRQIVYISGAITGVDGYKEKFDEAERQLRWRGCLAINPTILPADLPYEVYMPINAAMIQAADAVYVIPGWEGSRGVTAEIAFANAIGVPVVKDLNFFK